MNTIEIISVKFEDWKAYMGSTCDNKACVVKENVKQQAMKLLEEVPNPTKVSWIWEGQCPNNPEVRCHTVLYTKDLLN